jgi:hypothetical protein
MNDVVAIQQGIFRGLQSCSLFNPVNQLLGREFLVQSQVEQSAIWLTPRNGCQGVGMVTQIPTLLFPKPNSLQREREFSVGIYEERNMNFTPNLGTMTTAEDWADLVIDFMWNWRLWRTSGFILQDRVVVPDDRYPGIVGLNAKVILRQERKQPARAATPVINADDPNNVTIAVADDSQIYYTLDGFSFPGPANTGDLVGEQKATLYNAPFAAQSGNIVLAAAFSDSAPLPSQIATLEIP